MVEKLTKGISGRLKYDDNPVNKKAAPPRDKIIPQIKLLNRLAPATS